MNHNIRLINAHIYTHHIFYLLQDACICMLSAFEIEAFKATGIFSILTSRADRYVSYRDVAAPSRALFKGVRGLLQRDLSFFGGR